MATTYRLLRVLLFLALCAGGTVFAADGSTIMYPRATAKASGTEPAADKPGSVAPLVAALVLAAGGGWALWRARGKVSLKRKGTALSIHETRSLGGRQYLVVASYKDQKFLLGVCPGAINLLSKLEPAEKEVLS